MRELQKPKRTTLSAQIIEQMEHCIEVGIWPIGQKIPGEVELMESFGVSRNTVREATLSLVHAGLLRAQAGDGTYVISKDRLDAAMQRRLKEAKLKEIMEVRNTLELNIVLMASENGTAEDLVELKKAKERRDNADLNSDDFVKLDMEFHLEIARLCHNDLMFELYQSYISFIEDAIRAYQIESKGYRQHAEHNALYEAIVAHDAKAAVRSAKSILEMEEQAFAAAGLL